MYHDTDERTSATISPLDVVFFPGFLTITFIIDTFLKTGTPYTVKYVVFTFGGVSLLYIFTVLIATMSGFILSKKGYVQ